MALSAHLGALAVPGFGRCASKVLSLRRGSKVWKGRCAPRCNGGLRPPHAHKRHKIKPTIKIVQRAR